MKYELEKVESLREKKEKDFASLEPSKVPSKSSLEPSEVPSKPFLEPSEVPSKPFKPLLESSEIDEKDKSLSWTEIGKKGVELIGINDKKAYFYLKHAVKLGANQSWVFIKLASVCESPLESIKYLEDSWNAEPNEYYFLCIDEYEKIINDFKSKQNIIKDKFVLVNPKKIENPYVFLLYIKATRKESEVVEELVKDFLSRTKFSEQERSLELEITSYIKLKKNNIEVNEFEEPNMENDKKEKMLNLLKSYIEE